MGTVWGAPKTAPQKVTGKCGSVTMRLIPAPRGTGIVAANAPKKVLDFAGIKDVYTSARGKTCTLGNFIKATFNALKQPYQEHTDYLRDNQVVKVKKDDGNRA